MWIDRVLSDIRLLPVCLQFIVLAGDDKFVFMSLDS